MKVHETYYLEDGESCIVHALKSEAKEHLAYLNHRNYDVLGIREVPESKLPPQRVWVHRHHFRGIAPGTGGRAYNRKIRHLVLGPDNRLRGLIKANGKYYKVIKGWVMGHGSSISCEWYTLGEMKGAAIEHWAEFSKAATDPDFNQKGWIMKVMLTTGKEIIGSTTEEGDIKTYSTMSEAVGLAIRLNAEQDIHYYWVETVEPKEIRGV